MPEKCITDISKNVDNSYNSFLKEMLGILSGTGVLLVSILLQTSIIPWMQIAKSIHCDSMHHFMHHWSGDNTETHIR